MSLQNSYPPQNMILFGNRVLAHIIKVRVETKSYQLSVGPKFNENDLLRNRKGCTETPGRRSYEERDKDSYYAGTKQGTPADTRSCKREASFLN